jgi:hypothetical protein
VNQDGQAPLIQAPLIQAPLIQAPLIQAPLIRAHKRQASLDQPFSKVEIHAFIKNVVGLCLEGIVWINLFKG